MKKITERASSAFKEGRKFYSGNTCVEINRESGERFLRLHGNLIAKYENDEFSISLAGWPTVTTRERLNGLLSTLESPKRIYQRKHEQFIGSWVDKYKTSKDMPSNEFVTIKSISLEL